MPTTVSSPRTQRKRPADLTGRRQEQLAEEHKVELREQAERISMITQVAAEELNTVVDYSSSDEPLPAVEVRSVEVNSPTRMIRVNTDIDNMTYGREVVDPGDPATGRPAIMGSMNMYDFKEGQQYRVDKDLADHLQRLGYLSYISGA